MKHWLSDCSNKRRTHLKSAHIHLNTHAQDCLYPTHWSPVWFHQTGSAGLTEDLFVLSLCCLYVLSESCGEKCSHGYGLKAFTRAQTTRDRPPAAPQLAPGFPMSFLSPSVWVFILVVLTLCRASVIFQQLTTSNITLHSLLTISMLITLLFYCCS